MRPIRTSRPPVGQRREVLLQVGRADRIEHHVHPATARGALGLGDEVPAAVVHGDVRAQLAATPALLLGAGGDDDRRPRRLQQLDRRRADPAPAAVDQRRAALRRASPSWKTLRKTVRKTSGIAAASSVPRRSGMRIAEPAWTTTSSA